MTGALHLVSIGLFAALMLAAALEDFRRLVIPNRLNLALCALWPVAVFTSPTGTLIAGIEAAVGALAVFVAGAWLFSRGWIGGGDVKLLSVASLWVGIEGLPSLLIATGLFGGVLSLLFLTPLALRMVAPRPSAVDPGAVAAGPTGGIAVPYGVAIAAAALTVTFAPYFG